MKCPNLDLPQYVFLLKNNLGDDTTKKKLLDAIEAESMKVSSQNIIYFPDVHRSNLRF